MYLRVELNYLSTRSNTLGDIDKYIDIKEKQYSNEYEILKHNINIEKKKSNKNNVFIDLISNVLSSAL